MKIARKEQTWKGFFTYVYEGEKIDDEEKVDFTMELIFEEGSFTGFSTDSESENVFNEPAKVKGFIEDDKISFIKNYPCLYYKDENGNILLERDLKHPTIEYLGYYEENEEKYCGDWEIIISEKRVTNDNFIEEVIYGKFEIFRVK